MAGWVTPTGVNDPDTAWLHEDRLLDGNTNLAAGGAVTENEWIGFIEVSHAALSCDKVRYWPRNATGKLDKIDIDVYYDSDWHDVYEGVYTKLEWNEKDIPAGTKSVTKIRANFYANTTSAYESLLCALDFNEVSSPPTVTTQAASNIDTTTATGNGNITATGGENADHRGIVYGTTTKGDPGNTAPGDTDYDDYEDESGDFGTGAFTRSLTSLDPGTKYYARAYAHNSAGYSYGDEVDFTTAAGGVPQQAMHLMRMRRN